MRVLLALVAAATAAATLVFAALGGGLTAAGAETFVVGGTAAGAVAARLFMRSGVALGVAAPCVAATAFTAPWLLLYVVFAAFGGGH